MRVYLVDVIVAIVIVAITIAMIYGFELRLRAVAAQIELLGQNMSKYEHRANVVSDLLSLPDRDFVAAFERGVNLSDVRIYDGIADKCLKNEVSKPG